MQFTTMSIHCILIHRLAGRCPQLNIIFNVRFIHRYSSYKQLSCSSWCRLKHCMYVPDTVENIVSWKLCMIAIIYQIKYMMPLEIIIKAKRYYRVIFPSYSISSCENIAITRYWLYFYDSSFQYYVFSKVNIITHPI